MERIDYLPLGSVVLLDGGIKKLVIIARGLLAQGKAGQVFFDYGAVLYPEGLQGDRMIYFNHKDIAKVVFKGFSDDDDVVMADNINKYLEKNPDVVIGSRENFGE